MTTKKLLTSALAIFAASAILSGCGETDAKIASRNLSLEADSFQIERRIVFYDSIQGRYLLSIEGRCSIDVEPKKLAVTCKTSDSEYKKHFLGLADNVTFFC